MMTSWLLLTLVADPTYIESVKTRVEGGTLIIETRGAESLADKAIRTRVSRSRAYLYVTDTRVRSTNKDWSDGAVAVAAHRHKGEVELEAILPAGVACAEEMTVVPTADGTLVARVSCSGLVAGALAQDAAKSEPVAKVTRVPEPPKESPKEPPKETPKQPALALPPTEKPVSTAVTPAPEPLIAVPQPKPLPPAAVDEARPPEKMQAPATDESPGSRFAIAVLLGLAVLAVGSAVSRWRRLRTLAANGAIEILQNRTVGGGRSLLLARVEDETFLLAVTKAGIKPLRHVPLTEAETPDVVFDAAQRDLPPDLGISDEDAQATALKRLREKSSAQDEGRRGSPQ